MSKKIIIKNHRNKNRYYLTETGLWVRDFTKSATPEDINTLTPYKDYEIILNNELANSSINIASIDGEHVFAPNVVIVSDGYDFEKKKELLKALPQDKVTILGVNRSLAKWKTTRRMDWYLANNPYQECISLLPKHNYYPRCIVSTRTNPEFVNLYKSRLGVLYKYVPVKDKSFSSNFSLIPMYYLDDYRNPICAAISLSYRWGVQKLLLFCCDDTFRDERPGAEQLENGLWMYPQQRVSHGLIDGSAYWLNNRKHVEVKIADHSAGPEYKHVEYISEDELLKFFD